MGNYANLFTKSKESGFDAAAQKVDIYTVDVTTKTMLLRYFTQKRTGWMRICTLHYFLNVRYGKRPTFSVIKNSKTPLFLR